MTVLNKITIIIMKTEQEINLIPEYLGHLFLKLRYL